MTEQIKQEEAEQSAAPASLLRFLPPATTSKPRMALAPASLLCLLPPAKTSKSKLKVGGLPPLGRERRTKLNRLADHGIGDGNQQPGGVVAGITRALALRDRVRPPQLDVLVVARTPPGDLLKLPHTRDRQDRLRYLE